MLCGRGKAKNYTTQKMRGVKSLKSPEYMHLINHGEVSEWSKEHAWKVCILQKGIEGSNPSLSAKFNNKVY